ncbi:proline-rich family protein [Striga asiatica]|uniref:Proline-rich family protein n=1 Tax=Striga asiatica TaxID=4170 RepID=A0A5A7QH44_STRAF|nr:proline-rich family protein [Striga asiatica]
MARVRLMQITFLVATLWAFVKSQNLTTPTDLENKCGECPCNNPCTTTPPPPPLEKRPPSSYCPPPPSRGGQNPPYIYINGPPGSVYSPFSSASRRRRRHRILPPPPFCIFQPLTSRTTSGRQSLTYSQQRSSLARLHLPHPDLRRSSNTVSVVAAFRAGGCLFN